MNNLDQPGFMRRGWVGGALILLCCSCPGVRVPNRLVMEPSIGVEFWDAGDSALGEDIAVGKVWLNFREDYRYRSESEVPTHPGFLDRHDAALVREHARTEGHLEAHHELDAAEAETPDPSHTHEGEGASGEVQGLIESAEKGLTVVENATWATIGKFIVLLAALAAILAGLWYARRWWLTRSSSA